VRECARASSEGTVKVPDAPRLGAFVCVRDSVRDCSAGVLLAIGWLRLVGSKQL